MKQLKKVVACLLLAVLFAGVIPAATAKAASMKLSATKLTLVKGEKKTLKVTGASSKVAWSSSKKNVATVNSKGKVTAKSKGTTTITAKVGSKKLTCKVTVETPKLSKKSLSLKAKKTATLKVTGTKQKVKWSSSNTSVATVNSKGKVTAKKAGTAKITAKVGTKKYTCKVTVGSGSGGTSSPYAASYKKLKEYIMANGGSNARGNKVIQTQVNDQASGYSDVYIIEYSKKQDKLTFYFHTYERTSSGNVIQVQMTMEVNVPKDSEVNPEFIYAQTSTRGVIAEAKFKASSYNGKKNVTFDVTRNDGFTGIQEAANYYLKLSFKGWAYLLNQAGVSMKQLGFTSYK